MAATSLYIRPDEIATRNATVTTTAGTTDSDYTDDWLCDDKANRPAKATNGTVTWSLAFSSASIGAIVVANHNIDAGRTITIGGGISASVAAPAARQNSIPVNALLYTGAVWTGVTGFTVGVASNANAVVIGEVVAGPVRTFPGGGVLANGLSGSPQRRGAQPSSVGLPPYDDGTAARQWRSSVLATYAELDDLFAWFESQRNGSRFSVFIPDSTKNDAWLVELAEPQWSYEGTRYRVAINLQEVPRVRW